MCALTSSRDNLTEDLVKTEPGMLVSCAESNHAIQHPSTGSCAAMLLAAALGACPITASSQAQSPEPAAGSEPAKAETPPALQPPLAVTLSANPQPFRIDMGGVGPVYASSVISGFGQWQTNVVPGDRHWHFDDDNVQLFLNKADGPVQFFVQGGFYSIPVAGVPYVRSADASPALYTLVPQAYVKFAPTDNFSVMIGKLPTLIGAESTFTFQNMNIQRGLLWNQENAVNRGLQVNYAQGAWTLALSVNDGFYSSHPSWISGSASYAIDKSNTLAFIGAGNTKETGVSTVRTPLFQNNQQIYNLIYTHTAGPWTIQPYVQYSHVPRLPQFGDNGSASTYGGAVLASFDFGSNAAPATVRVPGFKLAARAEYLDTSGSAADGTPNLLYGPGSAAWSLTLTPTYQYKNFFARGELSYVGARHITPGLAFGSDGSKGSQARGLFEVGVLF
jgi:hypothetical protein